MGLGVSAILSPSLVPSIPSASSPAALATLAASLLLFFLVGARAFRTFLLTRRVSDLVVAIGIVWLGTSLVAALTMTYMQLGWWLGHGLELDGILAVGIPVALDLARSVQSRPLSGDLHASDLVLAEEAFLTHTPARYGSSPGKISRLSRRRNHRVAVSKVKHSTSVVATEAASAVSAPASPPHSLLPLPSRSCEPTSTDGHARERRRVGPSPQRQHGTSWSGRARRGRRSPQAGPRPSSVFEGEGLLGLGMGPVPTRRS
jgi:hypothetical protein